MANCYAEDAVFEDPAFSLKGRREDWRLEFRDIHADDTTGRAHWEAHYRFSVTKREVHNSIEAEFTFTPEGLIATHKDTFDFWRWSRQALGLGGIVLGWIPLFRRQMRKQARVGFTKYLANKP